MTPQNEARIKAAFEKAIAQARFNKIAAAVSATFMTAFLVGVFWWFDQLSFWTGVVSGFLWMQIYRECGGDPLNYPGDR